MSPLSSGTGTPLPALHQGKGGRGQMMASGDGGILVNRAPVLTLWAAVVAERLGHDADAAITLGRAVAGSSARIKARAIGLEEKHEDTKRAPGTVVAHRTVHLLGRDIPVVEQRGSLYALDHDKAASPRSAHTYVGGAFGEHLPAVRRAMEALADSLPPDELNRIGFRLYEHFRPEVPAGAGGWGKKGVLDLKRIENAHP